jgi:PKD repeat protein
MPPLPQASFTEQIDTSFGYDVSFDASSSSADPSASIQSYQWDFGDGTMYTSTYYSEAGHSYAKPGTYTVTLIVVDQLNQSSQPFTTTITINANSSHF